MALPKPGVAEPVASVPKKLPWMRLPVEVAPLTLIPLTVFPEITFLVALVVPPMVFPEEFEMLKP